MTFYQLIYNYLYNTLFASSGLDSYECEIMNVVTPFDSWLCHTTTIILIGLTLFLMIILMKWLFRLFSGLILMR